MLSAGSGTLAVHPVDTMKIRMQMQGIGQRAGLGKEHRSIMHGFYNATSKEGVRGLYRGFTASATRESTYGSLVLASYEPIKDLLGVNE